MGAGHRNHVATLQDVLGEPLRSAGVRQAGIQNGFHQREFGGAVAHVGTAHDIAHNKHVGLEAELVGAKAFNQLNAQSPQLIAHRWVDTAVAPCDPMPRLAC